MRVSYTEDYFVELPCKHPFPMGKFPSLYQILHRENLIDVGGVRVPHEVAWADLHLVHSERYLSQLAKGELGRAAERRMGLPWSEHLLRRSRLAVQGTINAAHMAIEDGIAANLAGGTHHAFPDRGEGFCVLNDVAVATRLMQRAMCAQRVLIIDLDVHQGNGTAVCLSRVSGAYTFSMHGEKNFPFKKEISNRDIELPDGTEDAFYLETLEEVLPNIFAVSKPNLVFYLAGVDSMQGDRYGRLALTRQGLQMRDRLVLEAAYRRGIPLTLLLSGGYAATAEQTADLHAIAHREARRVYG